jgi:hypothetical protein
MSFPVLRLSLLQRRSVPFPTLLGWSCLVVLIAAPCLFWLLCGESYLSPTERRPGDILVVESWIGISGLRAAAAEFKLDGSSYLIATGGLNNERWSEKRFSYAEMARYELIRAGVPADRVIAAPAVEVDTQRTFEMAAATWRALNQMGRMNGAINVFTIGPHARRSRLVFTKVLRPDIKVGIVAWRPPSYESEPWWHSSERAGEFLKESACYFFELLLNSGRDSNSPVEAFGPPLAHKN